MKGRCDGAWKRVDFNNLIGYTLIQVGTGVDKWNNFYEEFTYRGPLLQEVVIHVWAEPGPSVEAEWVYPVKECKCEFCRENPTDVDPCADALGTVRAEGV